VKTLLLRGSTHAQFEPAQQREAPVVVTPHEQV
jgi:hypothetical protein